MKVLNGTSTLSEMKWSSRSQKLSNGSTVMEHCAVSQCKINETIRCSTSLRCQISKKGNNHYFAVLKCITSLQCTQDSLVVSKKRITQSLVNSD